MLIGINLEGRVYRSEYLAGVSYTSCARVSASQRLVVANSMVTSFIGDLYTHSCESGRTL